MILPTTAKVTDGLCMPCYQKLPRSRPATEGCSWHGVEPRIILSGLRFELRSLAGYGLGIPMLIGISLDQALGFPGVAEQLRKDAEDITRRMARLQDTLDVACSPPAATREPSRPAARAVREVLLAARRDITGIIDQLTQIRAQGEELVAQRVPGLGEEFPLAVDRARELLDRLLTLRNSIPDKRL